MSVINTQPLIGASGQGGAYNIDRSLRFRASSSASLNRTPASTGSRKTWTWSGWVKRGKLGSLQALMSVQNGASEDSFAFLAADTIRFYGNGQSAGLTTNAVFRDTAAWYHVVLAMDTTQATAANRTKLYINGVQQTFSGSDYLAQNTDTLFNHTLAHYLGFYANNSVYLDGYLGEVNFIDGQALTPSSFGENDTLTGVWKPKRYAGTYGTNGFYLPFNVSSTPSYAALFNSSNYISTASNSALTLGTGDFTVEFWTNPSSAPSVAGFVDIATSNTTGRFVIDYLSGNVCVETAGVTLITGGTALPLNRWSHIAVVRQGTTMSLFQNGTRIGTTTNSTNFSHSQATIGINVGPAYGLTGYMSNLRIVKGTSVYNPSNTSITVPTTALTAISGTSLLTLQDSTPIDNSGNAIALTNNGSVGFSTQYTFTAQIANDASGNFNHWNTNNISTTSGATYDSMTDVPTLTSATAANYAVLNPLNKNNNATLSNGNLTVYTAVGDINYTPSTIALTAGNKYYFELTCQTNTGSPYFQGVGVWSTSQFSYSDTTALSTYYVYNALGGFYNGAAGYNGSYAATWTNGDVIGVAVDMTTGSMTFYKNGVSQGVATTSIDTSLSYYAVVYTYNTQASINFGQRPFAYTPPTGYVGLNTYNLPDSTIKAGNKVMDATLYTGNGGTQSITNSGGFKPDLVWVKNRTLAYGHGVEDSVRGPTKILGTNNTNAEQTVTDEITAFNANGFSLGPAAGGYSNVSGSSYVGWQWQAGQGTTSSNTNGSITSTVSVNPTAGFSVVTYTGDRTSSGSSTVGHGLGVAPSLIITKRLNGTSDWVVQTPFVGQDYFLLLDTTAAIQTSTSTGAGTLPLPTSTTFGVTYYTGMNVNGQTCVAYCWAEVAGFSKFGSYTGNGSTDGPFVYTGFKPKFVMWKRTDSAGSWFMVDSSRDTYNVSHYWLQANTGDSEQTDAAVDFLSNGFKQKTATGTGSNASGGSYIYMAFAENPFKYSLAR